MWEIIIMRNYNYDKGKSAPFQPSIKLLYDIIYYFKLYYLTYQYEIILYLSYRNLLLM